MRRQGTVVLLSEGQILNRFGNLKIDQNIKNVLLPHLTAHAGRKVNLPKMLCSMLRGYGIEENKKGMFAKLVRVVLPNQEATELICTHKGLVMTKEKEEKILKMTVN